MEMTIRTVRDRGNKARERVVLHVEKDLDVGGHLLLATRISSKGATLGGRVQHCFWFPNRETKAGDLVIVYSKQGRSGPKDNSSGNTSHFFYWGLDDSIWLGLRPVLIEIFQWKPLTESKEQLASSEG